LLPSQQITNYNQISVRFFDATSIGCKSEDGAYLNTTG
jgi:hypothetical protein